MNTTRIIFVLAYLVQYSHSVSFPFFHLRLQRLLPFDLNVVRCVLADCLNCPRAPPWHTPLIHDSLFIASTIARVLTPRFGRSQPRIRKGRTNEQRYSQPLHKNSDRNGSGLPPSRVLSAVLHPDHTLSDHCLTMCTLSVLDCFVPA